VATGRTAAAPAAAGVAGAAGWATAGRAIAQPHIKAIIATPTENVAERAEWFMSELLSLGIDKMR